MDKGAWWATVHGVAKGQTQLSHQAQHSTCLCACASLVAQQEESSCSAGDAGHAV